MSHPAPRRSLRRPRSAPPMLWGIVVGLMQAATPLVFWWLDSATVYALGLVVIAAVYSASPSPTAGRRSSPSRHRDLRFRRRRRGGGDRIAVALVAGLAGHGLKDLWQHRATSSPARAGGRRSAWSSTGSSPRHRRRDRRRHALGLNGAPADPTARKALSGRSGPIKQTALIYLSFRPPARRRQLGGTRPLDGASVAVPPSRPSVKLPGLEWTS